MRSLRYDAFGEPAQVLYLADLPVPEPGPGHVRVRLRARSINPSDLTAVRGRYGLKPELPATPGFEGMGTVETVGEGVEGVQPGDRVVPYAQRGTWQEQLVCPADHLLPVPDGVADEAAAQLTVNPFTAWVMLTRVLRLGPDDWLAQTAAGSQLARLIRELGRTTRDHPSRDGRLRGFHTVDLVRRPEQADALRAEGAEAVICTDDEPVAERLKELTGGGPAAAVDAVGGRVGSEVARSLRAARGGAPGGTMLVVAALSEKPLELGAGALIFKGQTVRGFWLSHWLEDQAAPDEVRAVAAELLERMARGELTLPVEASYDLADHRQAVEHAQRRGRGGKVVLTG